MGLAFLLMHHCHPVISRSGALPLAKRNYSQVEKQFWSQFLAWSITTKMCLVRKSPCGLMKKPWSSLYRSHQDQHPRDHSTLSRLQQYDYGIRYKPGKGVLLAGFPSRAFMKDCELSLAGAVVRIHANNFLPVPDHHLNETQGQRATICDPTLQRLKKTILDGSPMQKMQPSFRATADKTQAPPLADLNNYAKPQ